MENLSKSWLRKIYQTMVRIWLCEESFVGPILAGQIRCPVHLYSGQEAIAAGVCAALKKTDYVLGNHRSHGHYLAKGGSLQKLVAEIYCKESGCSRGRGGSMHVIAPEIGMIGSAPIVAGTIPLALGTALASKIRGEKRVTVSFFGDGASGEGALSESLNFAAMKRLPIIFACENNLYSTHLPIRECRPDEKISNLARAFCIPNFRLDGNDVLRVFEAARDAVNRCRKGQGPVFLEFLTYRMRGHVGPDDNIQGTHTDIRPKHEIESWRRKDPIQKFQKYLLRNGLAKKKELEKIELEEEVEVRSAHAFAQASPHPKEIELKEYVYK